MASVPCPQGLKNGGHLAFDAPVKPGDVVCIAAAGDNVGGQADDELGLTDDGQTNDQNYVGYGHKEIGEEWPGEQATQLATDQRQTAQFGNRHCLSFIVIIISLYLILLPLISN